MQNSVINLYNHLESPSLYVCDTNLIMHFLKHRYIRWPKNNLEYRMKIQSSYLFIPSTSFYVLILYQIFKVFVITIMYNCILWEDQERFNISFYSHFTSFYSQILHIWLKLFLVSSTRFRKLHLNWKVSCASNSFGIIHNSRSPIYK